MGGQGSGRRNVTDRVLHELKTPVADVSPGVIGGDMILPNMSGDASAGTVSESPTKDADIANKKYVDDNLGTPVTVTDSSTINFTLTGQDVTAVTIDGAIDHDSLLNFSAAEHLNWTNETNNIVTTGTVTAGSVIGKTGGSGLVAQNSSGVTRFNTNLNSDNGEIFLKNSSNVNSVYLTSTTGDSYLKDSSLIIGGTSTTAKFEVVGDTILDKVDIGGSLMIAKGFNKTIVTKTTNATLATDEHLVYINNSAAITITLPAASGNYGLIYQIMKVGTTAAGVVTLDGNGAETIAGEANLKLYMLYDSCEIICDGANWNILREDFTPHSAEMSRATGQNLNSTALTKINLDTQCYDNGLIADPTTNHRFDILRDGVYNVCCKGTDSPSWIGIEIHINGTAMSRADTWTHFYAAAVISENIELSAGDYVELFMQQGDTVTRATSTGKEEARMSITEVRD